MPTEAKPLFRPDALYPKLKGFLFAPAQVSARPKLVHWANLLASRAGAQLKETELLGDFLRDVFGELLGYTGPASGAPVYTIKRESLIEIDGKFADAALGRFSLTDQQAEFVVILEGKGPSRSPRPPLCRSQAFRRGASPAICRQSQD